MLDEMTGTLTATAQVRHNGAFKSVAKGIDAPHDSFGFSDSGGASRSFFRADYDETEVSE